MVRVIEGASCRCLKMGFHILQYVDDLLLFSQAEPSTVLNLQILAPGFSIFNASSTNLEGLLYFILET